MSSRFARLLIVCAAATAVACHSDKATSPSAGTADVFTPGATFSPFSASVAAGGTVNFHISRAPDGDGHNVIFDHTVTGAPDDINIVNTPEPTVVSRVFKTRGTFSYFCTVHPGMAGEVVVQ